MIPSCSSALTRRRQADGERETSPARSTLAIRPSAWSRVTMARSIRSCCLGCIQLSLAPHPSYKIALDPLMCAIFAIACSPVSGRLRDMTTTTAHPLTVPRGAALYIGALLGPGVLLLPGLAAGVAGPAAIVAWAGLLGVSALFAVVFTA